MEEIEHNHTLKRRKIDHIDWDEKNRKILLG